MLSAAVYGAGLAGLHVGWRTWDSRYALPFLAPALPLWAAAFAGLREKKGETALAVLLLAAAPGLWSAVSFAAEGLDSPSSAEPWPLADSWIRENVPPGDVVITTEPSLVALTTGRRAYFPPPAPSREAWIAALRAEGARWVLVHRQGSRLASPSDDARTPLSDFDDWAVPSPPLALAYSDDPEDILILRLD